MMDVWWVGPKLNQTNAFEIILNGAVVGFRRVGHFWSVLVSSEGQWQNVVLLNVFTRAEAIQALLKHSPFCRDVHRPIHELRQSFLVQ